MSLSRFICPTVASGQNVWAAGITCPLKALMLRTTFSPPRVKVYADATDPAATNARMTQLRLVHG